jgi:hypothetical protein
MMNKDVKAQLARERSRFAILGLLLVVVIEGALWFRAEQQLRDVREGAGATARPPAAVTMPLPVNEIPVRRDERPREALVPARCVDATARRESALRRAGERRDGDFVRYWDDYVYRACASPEST